MAQPYLKYQKRQLLFREAVLAFLGANGEAPKEQAEYCKTCRAAGMDDCDNCDPSAIKVVN